MNVKNSRGIVMKLICCTAVVVLAGITSFAQPPRTGNFPPKSGAMLEINGSVGTTPVDLKIYDSQIHSGVVKAVPTANGNGSNCGDGVAFGTSDERVPTDAYVLQGGAPTGCDPGDDFETSQQQGSATLGSFVVTTNYRFAASGGSEFCESAGNSTSVCIGGDNLSVDTGFLTVLNNGAPFTGTITLRGHS